MLDTAEYIAARFNMSIVTQPDFIDLEYTLGLTKVRIEHHVDSDPTTELWQNGECPFCYNEIGVCYSRSSYHSTFNHPPTECRRLGAEEAYLYRQSVDEQQFPPDEPPF
jgi:hypothetical protein